jgi:valyl-tRNA synthetase
MNLADFDPAAARERGGLYDRWIRTRLDAALREAHLSLETYRFNDAASALYQFVWGELCDWYIELAKPALQGEDAAKRRATQSTLVDVLSGALVALHPIMPFVTEEIFQALPGRDGRLVMEQGYPNASPALVADEQAAMDSLLEVVARVRQVRGELGLPPSLKVRLTLPGAAREVLAPHEPALRSLTGAGEVRFADVEPSAEAAVTLAAGHRVQVEVGDPAFLGEEQRRLEKALETLEKDLAFGAQKLENPRFVERAKPEVVAAERERQTRLGAERDALRERLGRLRGVGKGAA